MNYTANDPLSSGVDLGDLAILGHFSLAMAVIGMWGVGRRDLRDTSRFAGSKPDCFSFP